jgi:hypothetical protein
MSQYERNTRYLELHRIIYRRDPVNDLPTETFGWGKFYENGTHECYTLFNSKAKINTYKSLKWHMYVLWYLNPQLDQDAFSALIEYICDKTKGFVTFNVSEQLLQTMLYDVSLMDLEKPPPNKLRKIIFKDSSGLDMRQKLTIVGQMIGRNKISSSEIYDAMLLINHDNQKITIIKLAESLNCSTRTIHRNMNNELKKEKSLLNKEF